MHFMLLLDLGIYIYKKGQEILNYELKYINVYTFRQDVSDVQKIIFKITKYIHSCIEF